MNGSQPAEGQKPPLASGESSDGSSLVAKKRKKDDLKPIITTEGGQPLRDDDGEQAQPGQPGCVRPYFFVPSRLFLLSCHCTSLH